jgi:hypothetical protein
VTPRDDGNFAFSLLKDETRMVVVDKKYTIAETMVAGLKRKEFSVPDERHAKLG